MYFAIINGPNLDLLGKRQPEIYGSSTFEETLSLLRADLSDYEIKYSQSNCEGEIINMIHAYGFDPDCIGIAINPGAYAHYSLAIADAIEAVPTPVVEVHISNIFAREEFRHTSVTARAAKSIISGCGRDGYLLALLYLTRLSLSNSNPK
ncbi:MAG: type II 3-dehydroquinate dehydratase [Lepagella sp.]